MATFVLCHGAWSAAWAWKKVRPLLRAAGHEVFTPTYTGLGERAHQVSRSVDLETHIRDILAVLDCEDLRDVMLVGHSYGGMVATGVADRAAERIAKVVYLDAFVPRRVPARTATAGCCRPIHRRRIRHPRMSRGSPYGGAGSRSRPSVSRWF
jgi:pimeloyl-ACP methyl ester carboxylesterase